MHATTYICIYLRTVYYIGIALTFSNQACMRTLVRICSIETAYYAWKIGIFVCVYPVVTDNDAWQQVNKPYVCSYVLRVIIK